MILPNNKSNFMFRRINHIVCLLFAIFMLCSCGSDSESDSSNHASHGQSVRDTWPTCYVLTGENSLNVRTSPSLHKKNRKNVRNDNIAFQLDPGDTIYVTNTPQTVNEDGVTWLELNVSDTLLYASQTYLTSIPNRNYAVEDEEVNVSMLSSLISYIPEYTPWGLLFLTVVLFAATFLFVLPDKESFIGEINDATGMRPIFVFSLRPYKFVSGLVARFAISAVISVAFFLLLGCLIWGLLWVLNILMYIIIGIAFIGVLGSIYSLFSGKFKLGCGGFLICGIIAGNQESIRAFGNACVATGKEFFDALNIFSFVWSLVETYWKTALMISVAPLALFIGIALLVLLVAGALILFEKITTSAYNIKHPCPFCHNPTEPALYLSRGHELLVTLRPGIYGLLHITHPETGEKMPTTLLNGRDNLTRKCPHCDRLINYNTGVEKHIAFVGLPESGKTCLTYRFIGNLMRADNNISFTDEINNEAKRIILDIKNGKAQNLASKTSVNDMRRSIQILVPGKAPLPYHFFINDVGGELFTTSGIEANYMQFFKDVDSVSFLLDPFAMDFSEFDMSGDFATWYKTNIIDKKLLKEGEKFSHVLQTVKTMSHQFVHKTENIHVNIVLVKSDTGYIPQDVISDEEKMRAMVIEQMGLAAEVMDMENTYASLHFYAVSALKDKGMDRLSDGILEDLKVKL